MSISNAKTVFKFFSQGSYNEVLSRTVDEGKKSLPDIQWIVGSLSFLGKIKEAESLFESSARNLDDSQKAAALFFLGIGWTRRAHYAKAKKYFLRNHQFLKNNPASGAETKFYTYQGIAFYFFYLGEYQRSQKVALKALKASLEAENIWMRTLASDLVAHNMIFNGHIHEGLEEFETAQRLARKIENPTLQESSEISQLVYSCEYGINIKQNLPLLVKRYQSYGKKDNFSKNSIGLELSRQWMLRGEFDRAENILDEITPAIFSSENRRQEVRLNLHWGELCYLRNDLSTSQHYIRAARRCLNFVDQVYEIRILGLDLKVQAELTGAVDEIKKARLLTLSQNFSTSKNQNILSRMNWIESNPSENAQDMIHHYLQMAAENPARAKEIILEFGFFSWLPRFYNLPRGQNIILLGLAERSITLLSRKKIQHFPDALTTLHFKILKTLESGPSSKENLLQKVWGYTYDPLRHDSLIYSAMSSLRKAFGDHADFIQNSDDGYFLNAQMTDISDFQLKKTKGKPATEKSDFSVNKSFIVKQNWLDSNLNHRQIQILEFLQNNRFIDVKTCIQIFEVSPITASRDLSFLTAQDLLLKIGFGRATKYSLGKKA